MCILSGCDYLPSLTGIGLGKAFKFFSGNTNGDLNSVCILYPFDITLLTYFAKVIHFKILL